MIVTVILAFLSAACVNKWEMRAQHMWLFGTVGILDAMVLGAWCWMGAGAVKRLRKEENGLRNALSENQGVFLTIVFTFSSRFIQFGDTPRWDAMTYYRMLMSGCESFDFTLETFVRAFSMASHPTLGYAAITAIGEFLDPRGYVGVLTVWLLVNLVTAVCLYRIFEKILQSSSWVYHTLATCITMSAPLVLGTFSYYQPDAGAVCFFVFVVYCYLYKKNILMFFSMVLLLQTKEIGIVILGGFGLGAFIGYVRYLNRKKPIGTRIVRFLKGPLGICGIFAVFFLAAYFVVFLKNGGRIWSIEGNDETFSTFSLQPEFIGYKCKQYFILNFNWIVWGGNLILFVIGLIRRRSKRVWRKDVVCSIAAAAFAQMVFYSLYITYTLPRYHVLIDFCGVFLLMVQLEAVFQCGKRTTGRAEKGTQYGKYGVAFLVGALLFTEAYYTIDPLSFSVFNKANTRYGSIVRCDYDGSAIQRDFTVYNHQFNYLNRAYNHVLRDIGYHENMDLIIWNSVVNDEIFDTAYDWDTEEQKRTMKKKETLFHISGMEREYLEKQPDVLKEEAVFVMTPQFNIWEQEAEKFLKRYYEIRYKGIVTIPFGGEVTFYVCDLLKTGVE